MKEKIEQLAQGEFEYELPFLRLSVEEIDFSVEAGKQFEGSVSISNSANRIMKGIVFSSERLLTLSLSDFKDKECIITYRFNASYLKPSDIVSGNITILSDLGETILPFTVHIKAPTISTSIGKIKNLFEFANLARMDWTEAKKVFRSEEFERIILKNEEKYNIIYRNLLKSISTSQALEEFLITVNKKSRINLGIDKTQLEYEILDEDFMDKLILTKDHWGYAEIRVSTDAPFILLEQKFLWADRFIGNNHQISFVVSAQNMTPGNNFGRIYIKTVHQTITVNLVCKKQKKINPEAAAFRQSIINDYNYIRSYLDFRIGRINLGKYMQDTKTLLAGISNLEDNTMVKLMNIHLAVLSDNKRMAAKLLDELSKEETSLRKRSTFEYCAYLYLLALFKRDDETIQYVTDTISRYYLSGNYDWRILWFLLLTDKRYERNPSYKLADIKEQFDGGCYSPILYYEAICVYNEEPYLLRELNDFEIHVMNYGIKNNCLTMDLVLQYTYLAARLKNFEPIVFRGLTKLYKVYEKDEILSSICSLLIKGYKRESKYFAWYSLGVNAQLRITELYEYYMYCVNENRMEPLPQPLLIYFIYNSRLNDNKRAYLYANVIRNKKDNEQIYQLYYKRIEVFVRAQLEAKNISRNLAILYEEFMDKPVYNSWFSEYLPDVMFTQELSCDNPNMVSVVVVHKELEDEVITPLTDGRANIQIYTEGASVFMIDSFGNRYSVSIDYTLSPLLIAEEFHGMYMNYENHTRLLLYLFDHYQRNRVVSEDAIELRKHILKIQNLNESYYVDCLLTLIEYYYEYYDANLLELYLLKLDLSKVKESQRIKYLEYMVIRGYYDKALEALGSFGTEGISIHRLLKLCSGWITYSGLDKKEDLLLSLCYYIYSRGKYDETILNYLVKYYQGSTADMLALWQSARDFDIDPRDLEERLLTGILFTESDHNENFAVFLDYYNRVTNHLIVRAFLTYYAYKYLIHDQDIDDELFPIMRREQNYEENDICLLAWLKYNAHNTDFAENDLNFILFNIDRLDRLGIILPFFKNYKDVVKLPKRITERYFVEYKTNPKKQVFLHYRLVKNKDDGDYVTERMANVFLGIHVKEFVLFYNEELQYYVTEELEDEVSMTEGFRISYDAKALPDNSKYNRINKMLMALDSEDELALLDMMADYVETEYIVRESSLPLP
ncbi:MAG: hypothetical protein EWM47_00775 [Anaerolineaceae bacterium]|nr:MAG: hypothetical protein EWM47_00775 [Anaerolineaceae bacterium]